MRIFIRFESPPHPAVILHARQTPVLGFLATNTPQPSPKTYTGGEGGTLWGDNFVFKEGGEVSAVYCRCWSLGIPRGGERPPPSGIFYGELIPLQTPPPYSSRVLRVAVDLTLAWSVVCKGEYAAADFFNPGPSSTKASCLKVPMPAAQSSNLNMMRAKILWLSPLEATPHH